MMDTNEEESRRRREEERRRQQLADGAARAGGMSANTAVAVSIGLALAVVFGLVAFVVLPAQGSSTGSGQGSSGTPTAQSSTSAQTTATAPAVASAPKEGPLTVPFNKGIDSAKTTQSFSGPTKITVSGTGQASRTHFNDAFYIYTDEAGHSLVSPQHLNYADLCINGKSVGSFVQPIPAYNSSHTYTFTINAPGGPLTFGVCDDNFTDNTGSYTVMFS